MQLRGMWKKEERKINLTPPILKSIQCLFLVIDKSVLNSEELTFLVFYHTHVGFWLLHFSNIWFLFKIPFPTMNHMVPKLSIQTYFCVKGIVLVG